MLNKKEKNALRESMNGKGDARRQRQVDRETYESNWEQTFNSKGDNKMQDNNITKELFQDWCEVQESGVCNMISYRDVESYIGLPFTKKQHRDILSNYKKYYEEYMSVSS